MLSRNAWLVLVTMTIFFGTFIAFWKAERRIDAAQQVQRHKPEDTSPATKSAQLPVQQVLNIGDGTRLCGSVDVHVRKSVPHGEFVALLQQAESVIVDGPDFSGIVRLRVFARDPQRALVALQRSALLDAVTLLPHCR